MGLGDKFIFLIVIFLVFMFTALYYVDMNVVILFCNMLCLKMCKGVVYYYNFVVFVILVFIILMFGLLFFMGLLSYSS